jgi:hypothetical protein
MNNDKTADQNSNSSPNEKLPWLRFKWAACSGEVKLLGIITLDYHPTRAQINGIVHLRISKYTLEHCEPWDPFNCTLRVERMRTLTVQDLLDVL